MVDIVMEINRSEYIKIKKAHVALIEENEALKKENAELKKQINKKPQYETKTDKKGANK